MVLLTKAWPWPWFWISLNFKVTYTTFLLMFFNAEILIETQKMSCYQQLLTEQQNQA